MKLHRVSETYACTNSALFGSLLLLWKILSDSRKKPSDFRKKPSGLRRSRAANVFRKGVPNRGINFKDAYRTYCICIGPIVLHNYFRYKFTISLCLLPPFLLLDTSCYVCFNHTLLHIIMSVVVIISRYHSPHQLQNCPS